MNITRDNPISITAANIYTSNRLDVPSHMNGFIHYIHTTKLKQFRYLEFEKFTSKPYEIFNEVCYENNYDVEGQGLSEIFATKGVNGNKSKLYFSLWEILNSFEMDAHIVARTIDIDNIIEDYSKLKEKLVVSDSDYTFCYVDYKEAKLEIEINTKTGSQDYNYIKEEVVNFNNLLQSFTNVVKKLREGGVCVIKVYECFSTSSTQFISLLTNMFKIVRFIRPAAVPAYSSIRYLVCEGFKPDDTVIKTIESKKDDNIVYLNSTHRHSASFLNSIVSANRKIEHKIYEDINIIDLYLNKKIFTGEQFRINIAKQLKNTEKWVRMNL